MKKTLGTVPEKELAMVLFGQAGDDFWMSVFTNGEGDISYSMSESQFWQLLARVNECASRLAKRRQPYSMMSPDAD
jgi:hypothetical protein